MQIGKLTFRSTACAVACAVLIAGVIAAAARAEEIKAGDLVITQAWRRAALSGANREQGLGCGSVDRRLG